VAKVTTSATSTSTSRCGVAAGSANTAASVTTPRIPAQEMTAGYCQGGGGSFSRMTRDTMRGR
jgi:hypothetical protein